MKKLILQLNKNDSIEFDGQYWFKRTGTKDFGTTELNHFFKTKLDDYKPADRDKKEAIKNELIQAAEGLIGLNADRIAIAKESNKDLESFLKALDKIVVPPKPKQEQPHIRETSQETEVGIAIKKQQALDRLVETEMNK